MEKTTEFRQVTSDGTVAEIRVIRTQGVEKERVWLDGDVCYNNVQRNEYRIEVDYEGRNYYNASLTSIRGVDVLLLSNKLAIRVSNIAKDIDAACHEVLEDYETTVPAHTEEEIRELNAKAREYDRANNEGGYGYNPYLAEAERTKTITVKANN